uniref:MARVEL domain-containing protein n=2 Tax=Bursaphelenchus xylophilus TaxID=6326 RepID=A0A1I7RRY7_BURXY
MYSNISMGLRLFILLLCIIAMILIMVAPGVCFWRTINGQQTSREICPPSNALFPMNIDRWNTALHFQMRGQNVWGQLAIIILSILIAIPPLIFSCVYYTSGHSNITWQSMASLIALIAFLIFGAVETWYATGFDHMPAFIRQIGGGTFSGCAGIPGCETGFVVKGWAAAAAFYFFCSLFYLGDLCMVYLRRENEKNQRLLITPGTAHHASF